jgi:hypothetical protein
MNADCRTISLQAAPTIVCRKVLRQQPGAPEFWRSAASQEPSGAQLEVTRAHKLRAGTIAVTVLMGVTVCVLLITHGSQAPPLSLAFERYGTDLDFNAVAFLWLTNASDKPYALPMTGGTNTFQPALVGYGNGSYQIRCEFSDQANPMPKVRLASLGPCHVLDAHSALRLRVELPGSGQKRRVAVLCFEQPSGSPRRFWTKGIGLTILRVLPRSVGRKLLFSQPAMLWVWCDRELSHSEERVRK